MQQASRPDGSEVKPTPERADRPSGATAGAPAAEEPVPARQAPAPLALAQLASRIPRPVILGVPLLAGLLLLVFAAPRVVNLFTLPNCDDEGSRKTLADIFEQKNVKLSRLGEVRSVSSTRSERTCAARADIPGGILNLDYRIGWSGWSKSVTVTRAEAETRIEQAQLDGVKNAANDFLVLARDSAVNGRPPRHSEPTVRTLLDRIFDLSEIEGATLAVSDIAKANEWFSAGDRVGTVYILAGTGVSDINRLPSDPNVQRRTHRNVAEFAPEFARYLDFQVKLAGIMMDAELKRAAKGGPDMERPEVKREIAEVRTTLAETLTGDLTTLAYDGLTDDWRRQRLAVMMQVAPTAATFLSPEQAHAVRERALTVATFVRDKSVQDQVKALADAFAAK
jgi:hypothetical protein